MRSLLRDEVAALKIGKLPFPTRLLDALNSGLLSRGSHLPAQHFRALCEVTDERWRPAIEIAFARKFAITVSPEQYEQAEKIYHGLKASEFGNETGRESLINPAKALKLKKTVRSGSLAEKLKTSHPVAEAVVSHLFGDVMCVESLAQLRALPPDQNGILPDGFMTRGAFVERPHFYDGKANLLCDSQAASFVATPSNSDNSPRLSATANFPVSCVARWDVCSTTSPAAPFALSTKLELFRIRALRSFTVL
jgi:hypothetical protein